MVVRALTTGAVPARRWCLSPPRTSSERELSLLSEVGALMAIHRRPLVGRQAMRSWAKVGASPLISEVGGLMATHRRPLMGRQAMWSLAMMGASPLLSQAGALNHGGAIRYCLAGVLDVEALLAVRYRP
jgi:hypothetical protein